MEFDPGIEAIGGAYTMATLDYFASALNVEEEQRYEVLSHPVNEGWNWNRGKDQGNSYACTSPDLARVLRRFLVADDEIANTGPLNRYVASATGLLATGWHKGYGQWLLLALAALHIAAIVVYKLRGKNLIPPMITGDKPLPPEETSAGGSANKSLNETHERVLFSEKFACPVSGFTIPEIEPRLFSFNNPFGACPTCDGLGSQQKIDEALIIPETQRKLNDGAIAPWAKSASPYYNQTLEALGKAFGFKLTAKWADLPEAAQRAILHGTEDKIDFHYADGARSYTTTKTFEGIVPNLERRWKETDSAWAREEIERQVTARRKAPPRRLRGAAFWLSRTPLRALAVRAAGLNFRDVLWAMNMLPEEAVEDGFSGATIGMECAGEVVAVGTPEASLRQ